jgi:heme/copper-type cytochrome/quinol oxidase subunit 2
VKAASQDWNEHLDMTTLLCAIGALVILIYCAFVALYVRRRGRAERILSHAR